MEPEANFKENNNRNSFNSLPNLWTGEF